MAKHKKSKIVNPTRFIICMTAIILGVVVGLILALNFAGDIIDRLIGNKGKNESNKKPSITSSQIQPEPEISYEERVGKTYAIDINEYLQYIEPEDKYEYVFLVDPNHKLASDYEPDDLTDCGITRQDGRATQKLRLYAAKSLQAMMKEAELSGVKNVTATSAYRSYAYQDYLFNLYCEQNQASFATREECEKYVLTFSTKPGTSEHQSGLSLDMHNLPSAQQAFADKPEAKWLAENCYRFGFILRYPKDKQEITNIIYEPWHFRFVGREAATEMHELNMCLEEYIEYKKIPDKRPS